MNTPCSYRLRPPRLALLLLVVGSAWQWVVHGVPTLNKLRFAGGAALVSAGLAFMLWAWAQFKRECTPVCHRENPTKLVTSGPFRFTRNPMYVGLLTMLFGITIAVGTWPMLLPPLGFFVIISTVFIPCEERWMIQLFGDSYARYCAVVRRWL